MDGVKMSKYTFSTREGKAYYCNSIPGFILDQSESIVGHLVKHAFGIGKKDTDAWENQIHELQNRLEDCGIEGDIIFEYDIKRLGKRIDVIMLIRHMVFSLEFKNGKNIYTAQDAQQAEDYALDIKNFHKESENLYVCPILIATDAPKYKKEQSLDCYPDKQVYLQRENIETLIPKVNQLADRYGEEEEIDFEKWFNSPYHPTPTIIAAAVEAYSSHSLSEIANSEAGQADIDKCEDTIAGIINQAKERGNKALCFVTGVPGAGKTLVGLDIVAKNLRQGYENYSAYLSGNGPLVEVLREALKRSAKTQYLLTGENNGVLYSLTKDESALLDDEVLKNWSNAEKKRFISAAVDSLILSSYQFKNEYSVHNNPPLDHVLIFDEAQRVWSKEKMIAKHDNNPVFAVSEPHMMLSIMDRHTDWSVLVCLVGLGQDIYDGEVGINEWFRCAINEFPDWDIYYSPEIFDQKEDRIEVSNMINDCLRCHEIEGLHLKTDLRSFRADKLCKFVDALLDNENDKAREVYSVLTEKYPILITRDYSAAKKWVRSKVRGSERCGVLACSSAQRLKPEGIYVPTDIDVKNYFLAPTDDLRSSNMLEVVASEFKVQGLELDYTLVCWDADLRRNADGDGWDYYSFRGTKWNKRHKEAQRRYLINSYRVLLSRARQGMIIFVPKGVDQEEDPTRNCEYYNEIYNYLISCGIKEL